MIHFVKYHGTGNDFILIDGRDIELPTLDVALLCHRRFGIGADGLMIIQNKVGFDFEMVYYNSDGETSSMCGNGGRCIAHWAWTLGIVGNRKELNFCAPDGEHVAYINEDGSVRLGMRDVEHYDELNETDATLDTGSPHYVRQVQQLPENFIDRARSIRNQKEYISEGINVNMYEVCSNFQLKSRTFERGVEDETWSCGTGATAVALHFALQHTSQEAPVVIQTLGGNLKVYFERTTNGFKNVFLEGPATFVYSGELQ